jgi:NAD(P)-dependent dehydrogenase (short-subunit alcohol dehydrogenase family)
MKDLKGKVAVVTGAASGIGLGLAQEFAREGMKVVLSDIEEKGVHEAADKVAETGAETLTVVADVSKKADVENLAKKTIDTFGAIHIVCNNAGVMRGDVSWQMPVEDYAWHIDVNLWGVIHGVRTFVPILIEQDVEAHIVNTGSMSSLTATPYTAAYTLSKHAVIAFSECLYHELALSGKKIGVSVICPAAVKTKIYEAEQHRQERYKPASRGDTSLSDMIQAALEDSFKGGITPNEVARQTIRAIQNNQFYVLPEGGDAFRWIKVVHGRLDDIRECRNPVFVNPDEISKNV